MDEAGSADGIPRLLVALGFRAARRFAAALEPLGLEPRQYGVLTRLAEHEGQSQQRLGDALGITPTRMVFLVDDLEGHGLVERRRNPEDRRSNALFLTATGRRALERSRAVVAEHDTAYGASLAPAERVELARLLRRLAAEQGIDERALPGLPPDGR